MVFLQWILLSGEVKKILEVKYFFTCRGPGLMMGNRGGIQQGNMRNRGGEIGVWRQGQSGGSNLGGFCRSLCWKFILSRHIRIIMWLRVSYAS